MGLAERRALKAYQDNIFPEMVKTLQEAAGFETPVEVDWPSLMVDGSGHLYESAFNAVYFQPVIEAFRSICRDEMGKEALRAGLKKVTFCNTADKYNALGITFENGVLTIDHSPVSNIDYVADRRDPLIKLLEENL